MCYSWKLLIPRVASMEFLFSRYTAHQLNIPYNGMKETVSVDRKYRLDICAGLKPLEMYGCQKWIRAGLWFSLFGSVLFSMNNKFQMVVWPLLMFLFPTVFWAVWTFGCEKKEQALLPHILPEGRSESLFFPLLTYWYWHEYFIW